MHLYAFGSVVRGDISSDSDIDLLAIVSGYDTRFDPNVFSIYSYPRIKELWLEGNPFAWHLALEAKLLYATNDEDFLKTLGTPNTYKSVVQDCEKFLTLFANASRELSCGTRSTIFNLSTVFLSVRNFASCFLLGRNLQPDFSRHAALQLGPNSIPIARSAYSVLERARILSTRGLGQNLTKDEITAAKKELPVIEMWMQRLFAEVKSNG